MTPTELTLSDLLPPGLAVDASQLRLHAERAQPQSSQEAGFIQTQIRDRVASALDVDVLGLIAEVWARSGELRDAAERESPSGAPCHLFLAKHDVVCDNELKIALEFAGVPAVTDHLSVRLKAMFEGVGVTIEKGCITALDAGRGSARVELLYSNASLLGQSTDWVALPGRVTLARPVPIARAERAH